MLKWIDKIPLAILVILTIWLGGAPFVPEPHLVEKWRMLMAGTLTRPIDLFDFLMHGTPPLLLAIRLWRRQGKNTSPLLVLLPALLVSMLFGASSAQAQAWPNRPIKVVVGFPAGGVVDVMARAVTERLSAELGQPIVVENRPGAGSNIATAAVLAAPADGYTWLVSSNFLFVNPAMDNSVKWKASDFTPVARYALSPSFVLVPASEPWKTLRDFVEAAKQKPGMRFGDGGVGTTQSLAMQMLAYKSGIRMEPVYYKGAPPMVPDLAGGLLQMTITPSTVAIAAVQTGRIRALASTGTKRSPHFPDVPTMTEAGYPDATAVSWYGFHVAAGTPKDVVQRISKALEKVCKTTELKARQFSAGGEEAFQDTAAFNTFVDAESRRWLSLIKATQK